MPTCTTISISATRIRRTTPSSYLCLRRRASLHASAKAHQADIGNSIPTTYFAEAKDVYQEGSLDFPCVKVQENFKNIDDVIRMCRSRIRIPDQWYGDFLAGVGAARIGERRLKEFVAAYGRANIEDSSNSGSTIPSAGWRRLLPSCPREGW